MFKNILGGCTSFAPRAALGLLAMLLIFAGCAPAREPAAPTQEPTVPPREPATAPTETVGPEARWVEMAKADLQKRLGEGKTITVKSVEATEFRDTSLGVPEKGRMYAQVITPGYIIKLAADGAVYTYHAGGGRVVYVPDTKEIPKLQGS